MRMVPVILAAAVVACGGDDDVVSPPATLAAAYTLQTIDGHPLPRVVFSGSGVEVQTTAGMLSFSGNTGTFTQTRRERDIGSAGPWRDLGPRIFTFTFTREGNDLEVATISEVVPSAGLGFSLSDDGSSITSSFPLETDPYTPGHELKFGRN